MGIGYAHVENGYVVGWSLERHGDYTHEFGNLDWLNMEWSGHISHLRYADGMVYDEEQEQREVREAVLDAILASVDIPERPASKLGFLTVPVYDHAGNSIIWTFEPDPDYLPENDGSDYLKPLRYVDGMGVTAGLWYTDGTDIWECIKSGTPSGFTDAEYFDIIQ